MEQEKSLNEVALAALRGRITQIIPSQVRTSIEALNDEQVWWRPNEHTNSVGNLVLHVSGSMRYYLSRGVGGFEYDRNRPAEFAERGPITRQQLLAAFDEAISEAGKVLDSFDTSRFLQPSDEPDYVPTNFDVIFNVAIHLATHAGQIVYIAKMLNEGSLDELWIKAHKGK
jgi:uncharacterized damage-inducible protein DinB